MKWLYISGRGHSGSTFLDIVLGNSKTIDSFGEIISGIDRLDEKCSCGEVMQECPFWKSVLRNYFKMDENWLNHVTFLKRKSHVKYWLELILLGKYLKGHTLLKETNNNLFRSIKCNTQSEWILDSSKEPTRATFILATNEDAKVIHLVRSPVDVANSYKKRFVKFGYFKFLRKVYHNSRTFSLLCFIIGSSWLLGNIILEIIKMRYPKRVIRIRHEDLTRDFEGTLEKLGRFLGQDFNDIIRKHTVKDPFLVGHNIGGNHLKTNREVLLRQETIDTRLLSKLEILIINVTTFPLRWIYRYF